ncbi:unnamed protein product [Nippostrongylus brasiliensis]|uniref:MFS domain-containing protein n=1 Tax=Nippostrongylus brasiliensis TaxID=27835 RepID=A0A0N4Y2R2_NIPBR|nr:unnamed protein product [Nippostrongylus brasiliensis]
MANFRYVILLSATLSMTFIYSNRIVFGFTVICQVPDNSNTTTSDYFLNDSAMKAWMFTATAIGMCIGPIPLYWAYKADTRKLILGYGIVSALATLLYPLADHIGMWPSLAARFFTGFAQASQLHITNEVAQIWARDSEMSLFFSTLLCSSQIGPLFTMILGGELCSSSLGWAATYYVLGMLCLMTTALFAFLYTEDVKENRFVSDREAVLIIEGRKEVSAKAPVPYIDLLTDVSVWTTLVMFVGYYIGMIIYQQYSPTFIKQVLNYSIRETGYFSAIPMIAAIVIKLAVGKLMGSITVTFSSLLPYTADVLI